MNNTHHITVTQAAGHIEGLCETQSTGTIFMVTEKNVIAKIKLTQGTIVDIHYLAKRGMKALEQIFEAVQLKTFTFRDKGESAIEFRVDVRLPPQGDIRDFIKRAGGGVKSYDNKEQTVETTQAIDMIVAELIKYLGPMAAILCEGYFENAKNLSDIMNSLDELTSEIDNPVEKAEFKRLVKEKIQNI